MNFFMKFSCEERAKHIRGRWSIEELFLGLKTTRKMFIERERPRKGRSVIVAE